jgi:uncharacterized protein
MATKVMPDRAAQALVTGRAPVKPVDVAALRVLIISDGRAGHESQSLGLVQALGVADPEIFTLRPVWPTGVWARLARLLPVAWQFAALPDARRLDVVVGTGWQVSRVVRAMKRQNPGLFAVQLMRPSGKPKDYDVVVLPTHDLTGWGARRWQGASNVVRTLAAPNRITKALLDQEAARWQQRVRQVGAPRLAVLVGGATKRGGFDPKAAAMMGAELAKVAKAKGFGLLVSTSRRTGEAATRALQGALKESGVPLVFWAPPGVLPEQDFGRDNPYHAFLGLAEAVVVTADSVSMVSEAATAGKPVHLWPMPGKLPKKFKILFDALAEQGRVRWWDGKLALRTAAAGLMDTLLAAGFVRSRLQKRG